MAYLDGRMVGPTKYQYQHGFSEMHPEAMYDAGERRQKAKKSLAVIDDFISTVGLRPKT